MEERLCTWDPHDPDESGIPDAAMFRLYDQWGKGAVGNILTGSISCEHDQITQRGGAVVPIGAPLHGKRFDAFVTLARTSKSHGSLMLGQLYHPGRQIDENIQPRPVSASDMQQDGFAGQNFAKPRAATTGEISIIVEGFAHATAYLEKASFDGLPDRALVLVPDVSEYQYNNLGTNECGIASCK